MSPFESSPSESLPELLRIVMFPPLIWIHVSSSVSFSVSEPDSDSPAVFVDGIFTSGCDWAPPSSGGWGNSPCPSLFCLKPSGGSAPGSKSVLGFDCIPPRKLPPMPPVPPGMPPNPPLPPFALIPSSVHSIDSSPSLISTVTASIPS